MSSKNTKSGREKRFSNDAERWEAVVGRVQSADDVFVYSVKSTGVYCRPSCAAKLAKRENVRFHATASGAEQAGFRPCKRCRPNEDSLTKQQVAAVANACRLIDSKEAMPSLAALAESAGLSPSHFHRIFKSLTGVTPKAYATARRSQRVRHGLGKSATVTAAAIGAGFNSNGRFYANSAKLLGMRPAEFRSGGNGVAIRFAVGECSLGSILVGATDRGICWISLGDNPQALTVELQERFPHAELARGDTKFRKLLARVIDHVDRPQAKCQLPVDVQGTAFQQRVWKALTEIPRGKTATYAQIAKRLGEPNAVRAVASAIAANKIAVAIPCHRVVRTDGSLSGYRWGVERKAALLNREKPTDQRHA